MLERPEAPVKQTTVRRPALPLVVAGILCGCTADKAAATDSGSAAGASGVGASGDGSTGDGSAGDGDPGEGSAGDGDTGDGGAEDSGTEGGGTEGTDEGGTGGDDGGEGSALLPDLARASLRIDHDRTTGDHPWMVESPGDLTGDGVADLLLTELDGEDVQALVFDATRTGVLTLADADATVARSSGARMGSPAVGAADLTGDGHPDLFVAGDRYHHEGLLVPGPLTGMLDPDVVGIPVMADDASHFIEGIGGHDWTGDGAVDLLLVLGGSAGTGVALVEGPVDGPLSLGEELDRWEPHSSLRPDLSPAGDLNGDGVEDLVLGRSDLPGGDWGRVQLAHGPFPEGIGPDSVDVELFSNLGAGHWGTVVRGVGDTDGDGLDDVAVAAPVLDPSPGGDDQPGAVTIVPGGTPDGTYAADLARLDGATPFSGAGASLARVGDRDGDGHADLLVGSPGYSEPDDELTGEGALWFVYGPIEGVSTLGDVGWRRAGTDRSGLGGHLANAQDVDGDGALDVFAGGVNHPDTAGWLVTAWSPPAG